MKIAIIGGGINGLCAAWQLSSLGYDVQLFERGMLLKETSSSSSKLLHGGIRYLENFEFRLVKEALHERAWWLESVPQHTSSLKFFLPIYADSRRPAWQVKLGLLLYDFLAGKRNIGNHKPVSLDEFSHLMPDLKQNGLKKVYSFYDGQMDEEGLGQWVANKAKNFGAKLFENHEVISVSEKGTVHFKDGSESFDRVINIAGPWAARLNASSNVSSGYELDLVRGSHIVLNKTIENACILEVPNERRIFFTLPYQGHTLVGTTEVRQTIDEPIKCSSDEKKYLLSAYNHYFVNQAKEADIVETFAGVRPLIKSANDPGRTTREYAVEKNGKLITVFGGKWTTSRALAKKIAKGVNDGFY